MEQDLRLDLARRIEAADPAAKATDECMAAGNTGNAPPWPGRKLLGWLLIYKTCYLALIVLAVHFFPFLGAAYKTCMHWPRDTEPTLATYFATWDGAHYLHLSELGYEKNSPSCAFYPLWPLLIKGASVLTGNNHFWAGIVLSNVLSIAAILLFHRFVTAYHGLSAANRSTILLLAFPGALFFSFIYTESLFLLLITLFFLLLFQQKYLLAGIIGFFLPLTKAIGIFCLFPLLAQLLLNKRRWTDYLAFDGPILGYLAYFLIMLWSTGNAFEGFQAQRFFPNHPSVSNIFDPRGFAESFFTQPELHGFTDSIIDRAIFLLVLLSLYWVFRMNKVYFVFALFAGLIPAISSQFLSYSRNMMMTFPVFIALSHHLRGRTGRVTFCCLVPILGVIQGWFLWRHIHFQWAG